MMEWCPATYHVHFMYTIETHERLHLHICTVHHADSAMPPATNNGGLSLSLRRKLARLRDCGLSYTPTPTVHIRLSCSRCIPGQSDLCPWHPVSYRACSGVCLVAGPSGDFGIGVWMNYSSAYLRATYLRTTDRYWRESRWRFRFQFPDYFQLPATGGTNTKMKRESGTAVHFRTPSLERALREEPTPRQNGTLPMMHTVHRPGNKPADPGHFKLPHENAILCCLHALVGNIL